MIRKIIKINKDLCNGCGLCITACHEGAIKLIDGKAELIKDDYCDGLGNCLPVCPTEAISFEEREAANFDEEAVKKHLENTKKVELPKMPCGCPGSHEKKLVRTSFKDIKPSVEITIGSELTQWPVQIQLISPMSACFKNAHLLIAADCTAYAYGNFHKDFMKNKVTIIGCPKLDDAEYEYKLTQIIENNDIKSVTVVKMEVPCCTGIANYTINALRNSGKMIPWSVVTISTDGEILQD